MNRYFLILPLFFFAGCVTSQLPPVAIRSGEAERPLAWKTLAEQAFQHNPDLLSVRAQVEAAERARRIAAGDYLPAVDGTLNKARTDSVSSQPRDSLGLGVSASQNLFSGFGTTAGVMGAHKDYEAAQWFYRQTSAEVRFRLRSAYIELLRLERLAAVNRLTAERRKQNSELIGLRYEAGREHLGSAMRFDAIVSQADFDVRQTDRRIQSQSLRLGRELGGDFSLSYTIDGSLEALLPPFGGSPDFVLLAESSPQVQRLIKAAESAKAAVLGAQSEIWPSVDGTYDYGYSGNRSSDLKRESALGLKVSLPFFNGGKNTAGIVKARKEYDAAWENARSLRDEIVVQLSEAWIRLSDSVEQVQVRKNFLEASRKRSEIVRSQYSSGLSTFQEFDIAESDLADSEKSYVQSLADALAREADWQRVQGKTLEDVLDEK